MKKSKTKAQLAADAAFIAKIASITFGTGAKPKPKPFNESHPAWPKCPCHGSPMKLAGAGVLLERIPNPTNTNDDLSFPE